MSASPEGGKEAARARARRLAREHRERGATTAWFEALYAASGGDAAAIPWAELEPKRFVVEWLEARQRPAAGRRALVVGCGLGDDAAHLAGLGFAVTAFDLSPTAIAWCRRRFPEVEADFRVADLLAPPAAWEGAFDLVLDVYTVQSLPPELHSAALARLARFPAPGGELLLVSHGRPPGEEPPAPPWPLTRDELDRLPAAGLEEIALEAWRDEAENPPLLRFRAHYRRP